MANCISVVNFSRPIQRAPTSGTEPRESANNGDPGPSTSAYRESLPNRDLDGTTSSLSAARSQSSVFRPNSANAGRYPANERFSEPDQSLGEIDISDYEEEPPARTPRSPRTGLGIQRRSEVKRRDKLPVYDV